MEGRCHCGAVSWTLQRRPERLVDCNCSICSKLGVLWAHAPVAEVALTGDTIRYIRKDMRELSFHSCKICGCTTHWAPVDPEGEGMAVNGRIADPEELAGIPVRKFDGAVSWKFLD